MNVSNFFSENKYIVLPKMSNPKVFLSIDNTYISESFKLYNPFSYKGKLLKFIAYYFPYFNILNGSRSNFIDFIENRLSIKIITNIYLATDKEKVIVQLISDKKIVGYAKVAICSNGNRKIKHELNAIDILQVINPIDILDKGMFEGFEYFITSEIKGEQRFVSDKKLNSLMKKLERNESFSFEKHPRILQISRALDELNNQKYLKVFKAIIISEELKLVYEHGDFAPWNIMICNNRIRMFDFEYFEENGIEYFDMIKYYFQIENLLKKTKNSMIIKIILSKLNCNYKNEILMLFLLKEIILKKKEGVCVKKEEDLINILTR